MTDLLRTSRDGDQFHYLRAARLCLELLRPNPELVLVAVEGVAKCEEDEDGIDVIDLALYFGSADPAAADRVRYRQFKHSTVHAKEEWTASGLAKSLIGFGQRYAALVVRYDEATVEGRFRFEFETNRPIAASVKTAIEDLAEGKETDASAYLRGRLKNEAGLGDDALARFAKLIRLLPNAASLLTQRALLGDDVRAYLPDNDKDAPLKLKDLVARKATSEFIHNPEISRLDVLAEIGANEDDLFPARNLIDLPVDIVVREQAGHIMAAIIGAKAPVILQADGGVGKSVIASELGSLLPPGSRTFVYDCFGNGGYRSASAYRHQPQAGLVQLANEMAAAGLCDPLIPTTRADDSAYVRAFLTRVVQASKTLQGHADAILMFVLDASDNAETAAAEANDGPSFPRLLLRERVPDNVRLVLTARPHRVSSLRPPPEVALLTLEPFSERETAEKLRASFPGADDHDVREFHRLTSRNPRVQASAIAQGGNLAAVLAALGPTPRTVDDTIGVLLAGAIAKVRDAAVGVEQEQLDRVFAALATLRPFVPIQVVAAAAGVPSELVRSLAHDLQRPLLVREDAVQFRDEPTETWFRERFRPDSVGMGRFVAQLRPLVTTSAYVAAVLPQLMLEAGQFDALVQLALSGDALPEGSAIAKRDVELQRLQFALKAALRAGHKLEAAKLALKAGGEAAADQRQQEMLSANTDLAARFLETNQLVEQTSRRLIQGGCWTGSEHCYEAALLSGNPALAGDARARLRIAYDWLRHSLRQPRDEWGQQTNPIQNQDIAELQLAELNLHGPEACARQLRAWQPRETSFWVGRLLVARLVDANRFAEIDALALAAGNDVGLILAIAVELEEVGRIPPAAAVRRAARLACSNNVQIEASQGWEQGDARLNAVLALATAAARCRAASRASLAKLLSRYLPKDPPQALAGRFAYLHGARFTYLKAYALRAALRGRSLTLEQLATTSLKKSLKKKHSSEAQKFCREIGAILPFYQLWAQVQVGRIEVASLPDALDAARGERAKSAGPLYRDDEATNDEVARLWASVMLFLPEGADWSVFHSWRKGLGRPLFVPTLTRIARAGGLAGNKALALDLIFDAYQMIDGERNEAATKADSLVGIARAVLAVSEAEAQAYFNKAILVAGRIGDENLDRWDALMSLAGAAAGDSKDDPELAYRFARGAELTYHYVDRDKHFDWRESVRAMVGLSPCSSFAIASRWADRRFGRQERILPALVDSLNELGVLDRYLSLALVPLRVDWDLPAQLEAGLAARANSAERQKGAETFWRFVRFSRLSPASWRRIETSFTNHRITGIAARSLTASSKMRESAGAGRGARQQGTQSKPSVDWEAFFEGVDLGNPVQAAAIWEKYRGNGGHYADSFFAAAMERVQSGAESAFLDAFRTSSSLGIYELRSLLEVLPDAWLSRAAVRPALQALVKQIFRTEPFRVTANRSYQTLPLNLASARSGLSQAELAGEAIDAIGAMAIPTGASSLFQLAGLVSLQLSPNQGREALTFGLSLIEPWLDSKDGDGPWSAALAPPEHVEAGLAGYLWAALSAPERSRRWQAAHCVRALCALGQADLVSMIVDLAKSSSGGPFADPALRFYARHGQQWLLLALARAAQESGEVVAVFEGFLKNLATRTNRHVLIRGLASDTLLALDQQGLIALAAKEREMLLTINQTRLVKIYATSTQRPHRVPLKRAYEDRRFAFGIDFPRYQLAPLGRTFGINEDEMELMAEAIIRDDWGLYDDGHWGSDARAVRGYYRDDFGSSRSDGGPVENLSYYLSYHAMMELAGRLLETHRLYEDPDDDWVRFDRWLSNEKLLRSDGCWLFDLRVETPDDAAFLGKSGSAAWPIDVSGQDVRQLVERPDSRLIVAGRWKSEIEGRSQLVDIAGALASAPRADALARALQAVADPHSYRLPLHGEHEEVHAGGYRLVGWLNDSETDGGLDRYDPWALGLSIRTFTPAAELAPLGELRLGPDSKVWHDVAGDAQLWLETWSDAEDEDSDGRNHGRRLLISRALLDRLMAEHDMSLILEVEVKLTNSQDGKGNRDDEPSTYIALYEEGKEGIWRDRSRRPRRKDRGRTGGRRT